MLWAAAGFVTGLMLANGALAIWPVATLLVGVAFGSGMFTGERAGESYRFLGDQRLPPGHVWLTKLVVWFGMAAIVVGTIILGALHQSTPMRPVISGGRLGQNLLRSAFLLEYVPKDVFLLLWPVYGFSIGQLVGLVSRKSAVALVLSLLVSVPAVA